MTPIKFGHIFFGDFTVYTDVDALASFVVINLGTTSIMKTKHVLATCLHFLCGSHFPFHLLVHRKLDDPGMNPK